LHKKRAKRNRCGAHSGADGDAAVAQFALQRLFALAMKVGRFLHSAPGPMNASVLAQLACEKGLFILAASKDSEPALEPGEPGGGHGFLTYALAEAN
jgi:hypothetical protein